MKKQKQFETEDTSAFESEFYSAYIKERVGKNYLKILRILLQSAKDNGTVEVFSVLKSIFGEDISGKNVRDMYNQLRRFQILKSLKIGTIFKILPPNLGIKSNGVEPYFVRLEILEIKDNNKIVVVKFNQRHETFVKDWNEEIPVNKFIDLIIKGCIFSGDYSDWNGFPTTFKK